MVRILYIDDAPSFLKLGKDMLEREGYEVLVTTTSQEALTILNSQSVDLVIQDYNRPEMDGGEFLKHMKDDEKLRKIPVVVFTAGGREDRTNRLKQHGLDIDRDLAGFIQKPVLANDFQQQIAAIIDNLKDDTAT